MLKVITNSDESYVCLRATMQVFPRCLVNGGGGGYNDGVSSIGIAIAIIVQINGLEITKKVSETLLSVFGVYFNYINTILSLSLLIIIKWN